MIFLIFCTWESDVVTLREEYTLKLLENMVLREIFGSKGD